MYAIHARLEYVGANNNGNKTRIYEKTIKTIQGYESRIRTKYPKILA